jgi:hypothetical protein
LAKGRFWGAAPEITFTHRPLLIRLPVSVGWRLSERNRPIVGDGGRNRVEVKSRTFSLNQERRPFDGSAAEL